MGENNPKSENPIENDKDDQSSFGPEFQEIDSLNTKVVELEQSVGHFKDQLLRKAAEFENYKKRTDSDYQNVIKFATEDLVTKLLPVLDDFERFLKASKATTETGDHNVLQKGVELIYNKFVKILENQGVKHFDVVGKPFDPQYHDALMQVPKSEVPPNTIIEEVEKGYLLNDKVIRHARVIVSAEVNAQGSTDGQ